MLRPTLTSAWLLTLCIPTLAEDWPQWRGPTRDNHAPAGATAPASIDPETAVAWRTPLPGRGHSSPVVSGDRIYLTTADEGAGTQGLLVLSRATGELLANTVCHRGGLPERIHPSNTHASPTAACDGQRVFALFHNDAGAWVTAFDLAGKQLWQKRVCGFNPQQFEFGFGSSPMLHGGLLLVAAEYDGPDSGLYALDPATGEQKWKAPRPENITFSTPVAVRLGGRDQLLLSGANLLAAYDPATGKELWQLAGATRATCGTMVWDEALGLAFASGGFPDRVTEAVRADGSEVAWKAPVKNYEPSMLAVDGALYCVADGGVAHCLSAADGKVLWRERIGGKFSASPVLVGGVIYAVNEQGALFAFRPNQEKYDEVARAQYGTEAFATPTPIDGRLLHRYAEGQGAERREYLVAIGKE